MNVIGETVLVLAMMLGSSVAFGQQNGQVIAEVDGDKLTSADLQHKEGNKLLQSQYQYYQAARKALDDLIDQHLLEKQAQRNGIAVDELLKREVDNKIKGDPTDDQMRLYYEGMETEEPYEQMRGKILQHIREVRRNKARATYLKSLRAQAQISVSLAPPIAAVDTTSSPIRGSRNAPVLLVEFADYQCPYCQKIHPELEKLQQEFAGKLAVSFKDFPLPMHPYAEKAAEAARCSGAQGKFWEYHDLLFTGKKLELPNLKEQARSLNLNTAEFDKCLDSGSEESAIQKDVEEGKSLGLTGTPSFFINGHFFSGSPSYAALHDMVAQEMNRPPSSGKENSLSVK